MEPPKLQPAATKPRFAGAPLNPFSPGRSIASVHRRDKIFYPNMVHYETIDATGSIASASLDSDGEKSPTK